MRLKSFQSKIRIHLTKLLPGLTPFNPNHVMSNTPFIPKSEGILIRNDEQHQGRIEVLHKVAYVTTLNFMNRYCINRAHQW